MLIFKNWKRGQCVVSASIKGGETDLGTAFQAGSLQVVLDHLLHFGRYLTPQIVINLRELAEEWGRDELSMPRCDIALTSN